MHVPWPKLYNSHLKVAEFLVFTKTKEKIQDLGTDSMKLQFLSFHNIEMATLSITNMLWRGAELHCKRYNCSGTRRTSNFYRSSSELSVFFILTTLTLDDGRNQGLKKECLDYCNVLRGGEKGAKLFNVYEIIFFQKLYFQIYYLIFNVFLITGA